MSKVCFLNNIGVDRQYNNTIDFANKIEQDLFWDNRITNTYMNLKFIASDVFTLPLNYNLFRGVNYCYFENDIDGIKKRTYAFISDIKMITATTTKFTFEVDVMQTYMFDYELKESFVEREHQDRFDKDKALFSLTNEIIDYGQDYKKTCYDFKVNNDNIKWLYIISSQKLGNGTEGSKLSCNGVVLPYYVYIQPFVNMEFPYLTQVEFKINNQPCRQAVRCYLDLFDKEYIKAIFVSKIPPCEYTLEEATNNIIFNSYKVNFYFSNSGDTTPLPTNFFCNLTNRYASNGSVELTCNGMPTKIYNNINVNVTNNVNIEYESKLKCYPYDYNVLNYGGNSLIIKNEMLGENFKIYAYQSFTPDFSSAIILRDYCYNQKVNDVKDINDYIITKQTPYFLPLMNSAWSNYIQENSQSRIAGFLTNGITTAGSITGLVGSFASANLLGVVASIGGTIKGFEGIYSKIAKENDIKNVPNDIKQFMGDIGLAELTSNYFCRITKYEITNDYKNRISNYFIHYGYRANDFKVPDLRSRYYYNYIKTANVNLTGSLNSYDLDKLREIYNKGITIWHYRTNETTLFLDYSKENCEMKLLEEN